MKTFLRAVGAAALLVLPSISAASSLDYVQSGSNYTVLFNPNGPGTDNLPASFFYRSYDCRIGSKPVVITNLKIITPPPPTGGTTPPPSDVTPPPPPITDNGTTITTDTPPPPTGDSTPPKGGCDGGSMPAVPLPASSEMAGAGLAVIALSAWHRARRLARA